jgi:hypothetical protein
MAGIADRKPIILEKWTQGKNPTGSLADTLVQRYTAYAEITQRDLAQDGRVYENFQTKVSQVYYIKLRSIHLQVDALWKVVYRGRRLTVLSKKRVEEKDFYYTLTVECK